ncbi:MAG TPA: hypothetical protein VFX12_04215 [Vicinamibacterales bacterium]|nr:hypothetical protein [Vicinamibacterales bacterium]
MSQLSASAPTYTIQDLGTIGGLVPNVTGINTDGQVSGTAQTTAGSRPVRYTDGVGFEYLSGFDAATGVGSGVTAHGDMAGYMVLAAGQRAYRYVDGAGPQTIDPIDGGAFTIGTGINSGDEVTGYTTTALGVQAFRAMPNTPLVVLPTLGGGFGVGLAINDSGQVAGTSTTTDGSQHAFRANVDGTIDDLGSLSTGGMSMASAIDAGGDVVGRSLTAAGAFHAFRYSDHMEDIDTLGSASSNAMGVAGSATVGAFQVADGSSHAFVHTHADGMVDLNTRIPADSGWVLQSAVSVNASGQIAGMGMLNGQQRAFRLTPDKPVDLTPPVISSITASPSLIAPPAGQVVPVTLAVAASDDTDPAPVCSLTSITASAGTAADSAITGPFSGTVRAVGNRTYVFGVTCTDASGNHSDGTASVVVPPDVTAPVITGIAASPSVIWPPNGAMVPVTVTITATDDVDATPVCAIDEIGSSEGTANDAQVTGDTTARVRALKGSKDDPRVYTIHASCADAAGNVSGAAVTVTVARGQAATTFSSRRLRRTHYRVLARRFFRHHNGRRR